MRNLVFISSVLAGMLLGNLAMAAIDKHPGGSLEQRVSLLERKVAGLQEQVNKFHARLGD